MNSIKFISKEILKLPSHNENEVNAIIHIEETDKSQTHRSSRIRQNGAASSSQSSHNDPELAQDRHPNQDHSAGAADSPIKVDDVDS
jgi:hypothetical protein